MCVVGDGGRGGGGGVDALRHGHTSDLFVKLTCHVMV